MPQLPLFEDAPHPASRSIARSTRHPKPRSPRPPAHRVKQIPLTDSIAPVTRLPQRPIVSELEVTPACSTAIALLPTKELPQGSVDPSDPAFDYLKNCRLCGAPIKLGGLDHSLCSGDCGWVVDLIWLARQQHLKRGCASVARSKEPEPQAATHTKSGESEALDLFTVGLDRDTVEADGGVA